MAPILVPELERGASDAAHHGGGLLGDGPVAMGVEGRDAREHGVEDAAGRPHIAGLGKVVARPVALRSAVGGCAYEAGLRHVRRTGQPVVADDDAAVGRVRCEQQVLRLEVSVDEAKAVQRLEPKQDVAEQACGDSLVVVRARVRDAAEHVPPWGQGHHQQQHHSSWFGRAAHHVRNRARHRLQKRGHQRHQVGGAALGNKFHDGDLVHQGDLSRPHASKVC
mmetsp:Transcript_8022/g.31629  ORF Transcript_8022/g.31629 Transcript_8022/m.31629 type:complete len:222 (-) Transcript_8022:278-943(-)